MGMNRNIVTGSPLQNAAAILLGDVVTEDVAETGPDVEMISVSDTATENPAKRKRGRPSATGVAMTAAERSRKYRERHRPAWSMRRVCLSSSTVERAEKLAAVRGVSVAEFIDSVVREDVIRLWSPEEFELIKAAAAKSGDTVEAVVNFALCSIPTAMWDERAEHRVRYRARRAAKARLADTADVA